MLDLSIANKGLRLLYTDTVAISRVVSSVRPNGTTAKEYKQIYIDIPCRLSQATKQKKDQLDPQPEVICDAKLFCNNDVDIIQGDYITAEKEGHKRSYYVGDVFTYASHTEVALYINEKI